MNHDQTTAELRKRIGQTSASLNQCAAQDKAISTGATARFKQVQARMEVVRKTAITDPKAADEYLDLTKERAQKLEGWKPLWTRYPVPAGTSGAPGFVGQPPKAGETTPTVSPQGGAASVGATRRESG